MVRKSALVSVLRSCDEGNLRLVVLNACHTRSQAEALTEVVDCVVSMNRTISDRAAIKFAASFYGALAFGRSVQTAFDQGVARLRAEGIAEAGTPELLVRAGIDGSRVILVGAEPPKPGSPAAECAVHRAVPAQRGLRGAGRRPGAAARQLVGSGVRPGRHPPGGPDGHGRHRQDPARRRVRSPPPGRLPGWHLLDRRGRSAGRWVRPAGDRSPLAVGRERPAPRRADPRGVRGAGRPAALRCWCWTTFPIPPRWPSPLLPDCVPEDLRCRLLFTTRRHDLGRFAGVEVTVLAVSRRCGSCCAIRLDGRPSIRPHPDHEHARAIARMLGRLPLALELAGAYLGKFSGDVSLESYREGLRSDGALATLDADAAELTEADLRRVHDPAVAATIGEQWGTLGDESARLLLRVASLFPESSAVPIARLGLLAGLGDRGAAGTAFAPPPRREAPGRCLPGRAVGGRPGPAPSLDPRIRRRSNARPTRLTSSAASAWNGRLRPWSIFRRSKRWTSSAGWTASRRT